MTGLFFKLQRASVITGHVFDENGEVIQGALVRVLRPTGRGKRQDTQEAGTGVTNDLGEFRIYGLSPGRYYVAVTYVPWSAREGFDPKPRQRLFKKGYPTTYFSNTTDPSKAQTLALYPGKELTSIDFRIELVADNTLEVVVSCRAPRLEGQVLTGDSLPAVGVFVVLVPEPRLGEQSSNYATAKTDQNGHFILKGILPGDYKFFSWDSVEEGDWSA
jgi:hypothetical protein